MTNQQRLDLRLEQITKLGFSLLSEADRQALTYPDRGLSFRLRKLGNCLLADLEFLKERINEK